MEQVHVVRHKVLVEGRSISAVAREMEMSRNTIRKYLSLSEPKRVVRRPKASPTTEMVAPRIDELLEEWRDRTTPKQRITGTRIHRQLVEEGYEVGVTTVRGYLREKRREKAEVFIPLIHRPGDEAQVDFFEVTVEEVVEASSILFKRTGSGIDGQAFGHGSISSLPPLEHDDHPSSTNYR